MSINKELLIYAEKAFTVVSYIHYSGGPLLVLLSGGISEGENGDDLTSFALINIIFSIIYLIAFLLLLLRWKKVIPVILKGGLVWLLLLIAFFSFFWSSAPDITKIRTIALAGTMIFSLYVASRYTLKEQLNLIAWTFGIVVIMSVFFAVILPKYGQMGGVHFGAWRGIYNHKNVLGKMMVIGAMAFALLGLEKRDFQRWISWAFFILSVLLIVLSRASSPLLNLLIVVSILIIVRAFRWRYMFMVPVILAVSSIAIITYSFLLGNAGQVAGAFGKDLTLTGRTNFWPLILDKIWENPLLGYGFGAFWQGLDGPSAYIWNASTFKAPNGHNGYLDLCLELGFVGVSIYLIKFIASFAKALNFIRVTKTSHGFWPTLLFCYIILSNLTESSLMLQNNILWIMQVTTFLSLYSPQSRYIYG